MSAIDRTRDPRTVNLRRRLLAGAITAAAISITGLPARPVFAQDIVVAAEILGNDAPTPLSGATVEHVMDLRTRIDSLRVRAASSVTPFLLTRRYIRVQPTKRAFFFRR